MTTRRITIIRNSARCLRCGDHLESRADHDSVWCRCGSLMVDGGRAYRRRVCRDVKDVEETSILAPAECDPAARPDVGTD